MDDTQQNLDERPFMPEITPQLIPVPETKKEEQVPIDVVNGALDELRRKENGEGDDEGELWRPTIH